MLRAFNRLPDLNLICDQSAFNGEVSVEEKKQSTLRFPEKARKRPLLYVSELW